MPLSAKASANLLTRFLFGHSDAARECHSMIISEPVGSLAGALARAFDAAATACRVRTVEPAIRTAHR
jgi:hypothetical protein